MEQEKDKRYKLVRNKAHCVVNTHLNTAPGGWWHRECFCINLNYNYGGHLEFIALGGMWHSSPFIKMKINPSNCNI